MPLTPAEVLAEQDKLQDKMNHPDSSGHTEYLYGFSKDVYRKTGTKGIDAMFYPFRSHKSLDEARGLALTLGASLRAATTYQVTGEMVAAVTAMYEKSAAESEFTLEERELPSLHGFAWLDEPLTVVDRHGRRVQERAISWGTTPLIARDEKLAEISPAIDAAGLALREVRGLRVVTWNAVDDFSDEYSAVMTPEERAYFTALGLALSHTMVVAFQEMSFASGKVHHPETGAMADNVMAWAHTLWMFMGTEIVTQPRAHLDRAAIRRTTRTITQPEVRVVLLRRAASHERPEGTEPREVDWTCRWVVQGHWRHLGAYKGKRHRAVARGQHCAECGVKLTWVRPYLKPDIDGLPLKATGQVLYKLAR